MSGLRASLSARYFSIAGRADSDGTRKRAELFGWKNPVKILEDRFPGGLLVGRVGFGSPEFAAASKREHALRAALACGCNFIELEEAIQKNDPRFIGNDPTVSQDSEFT